MKWENDTFLKAMYSFVVVENHRLFLFPLYLDAFSWIEAWGTIFVQGVTKNIYFEQKENVTWCVITSMTNFNEAIL